MRALIKQLIPPVLLSLAKTLRNKRRSYWGLNNLDQKLERYLDYDKGYFVELGANDGESQSNTLYFERHREWHGVLVEPVPHNYLKCRQNRSTSSHVFCYACTSFEYKEKYVEIAYSNLMSTPMGLESDVFNPLAHAESGKELLNPSDDNLIFGALARPLNELLIEAKSPNLIDLLSLDVEGAEIEVLKGIDHTRFKFKFMCIESRSKDKLISYLDTLGYQFVEQLSHHDYLFRYKASELV